MSIALAVGTQFSEFYINYFIGVLNHPDRQTIVQNLNQIHLSEIGIVNRVKVVALKWLLKHPVGARTSLQVFSTGLRAIQIKCLFNYLNKSVVIVSLAVPKIFELFAQTVWGDSSSATNKGRIDKIEKINRIVSAGLNVVAGFSPTMPNLTEVYCSVISGMDIAFGTLSYFFHTPISRHDTYFPHSSVAILSLITRKTQNINLDNGTTYLKKWSLYQASDQLAKSINLEMDTLGEEFSIETAKNRLTSLRQMNERIRDFDFSNTNVFNETSFRLVQYLWRKRPVEEEDCFEYIFFLRQNIPQQLHWQPEYQDYIRSINLDVLQKRE